MTYLNSEFLVFWYLTETNVFWKYHVFPARISRKKLFSLPVDLKGAIFCSGTGVFLLKVLYVCLVFCSDLVLFIFSDGTAVFLFLLFIFLFSFSVVKSILCVSFSADTVTSSNEELLLSEMSELESSLMNNSGRRRSHQCQMVIRSLVNLLNTKRILLYISNQSVPRCKHFPPRL